MKGLLYKDLCLIKKPLINALLIMSVVSAFFIMLLLGLTIGNFQFDFVDTSFIKTAANFCTIFIGFMGIYFSLSGCRVMEMDEKSEWYKVLYSSPVSLGAEITSRYCLIFIYIFITTVYTCILQPVFLLICDISYGKEAFKIILFIFAANIIFTMIRLPLEIIFSAKLSTIINIVFIFVLLAGLMVWLSTAQDLTIFIRQFIDIVEGIRKYAVILLLILICVSYSVSYFFKGKRRYI